MRRQIASDAVVLTDNEFKGLPLRPVRGARRTPRRRRTARRGGARGARARVAAVERGDGGGADARHGVLARALAVFAAMVGIQVVTAHDAMPPALRARRAVEVARRPRPLAHHVLRDADVLGDGRLLADV